mmetsp:Transcript_76324/g.150938  ORF Transcript_76324/g.150938 Transcript_76324/m.150938 type:complete len:668 (-) Transcript_76324:243-2246(-)|eukprot:CAMPEP_0172728400 /NCGR_PEP_ID=MMETSP1074-20121228/92220_1 /TAXON_ID=2916 /ORGANISM="Ceratium fusus, Strain PA161109" /LENGTH=667 /DNA_ID=CAMNT_0013555647 /DNA_START=199 /DNA_END=2202 /DNA_ORIENTATION=+
MGLGRGSPDMTEGWLEKRYPLCHGRWQRRWCSLCGHSLRYFVSKGGEEKGCIEITENTSVVYTSAEHQTGEPSSFVVKADRHFYFRSCDDAAVKIWIQAIEDTAAELRCTRALNHLEICSIPTAAGRRSAKDSVSFVRKSVCILPGLATTCSKRTTLGRTSYLGGLTAPNGGCFYEEDMRPVWDVYDKMNKLGSGAFGTVYRVKECATGKTVALKEMQKSAIESTSNAAMSEYVLCAEVTHPHIIRVYGLFDEPEALYISSELAARGELPDFLAKSGWHGTDLEEQIAKICVQVLLALVFLHTRLMIHHDVKPPNILVTEQNWSSGHDDGGIPTPVVVLSDFGTARLCQSLASDMHGGQELLGTAEYCGPEVFEGRSGDRTDVYALGVTVFELFAGEGPFEQEFDLFSFDDDDASADRFRQLRSLDYEADWTRIRHMSDDGRSLVQRMMTKTYEARPSAQDCYRSTWFGAVSHGRPLACSEARARLGRLQRRAKLGFYAKVLMNMLGAQLSGDLLQQEREIFRRLDANGRGCLKGDDLQAACQEFHFELDKDAAHALVRPFDLDRSGSLSFTEWIGASMAIDSGNPEMQTLIDALFSNLAATDQASTALPVPPRQPILLPTVLRARLGVANAVDGGQSLDAFFAELDTDGDGVISASEFQAFWQRMP